MRAGLCKVIAGDKILLGGVERVANAVAVAEIGHHIGAVGRLVEREDLFAGERREVFPYLVKLPHAVKNEKALGSVERFRREKGDLVAGAFIALADHAQLCERVLIELRVDPGIALLFGSGGILAPTGAQHQQQERGGQNG